jgi:PmbA protein
VTRGSGEADTAFRVGDALKSKTKAPWEVYAERVERFEIHLNGSRVELRREPIRLEGFGVRLFRSKGKVTHVGFASSTDLGDAAIQSIAKQAEENARYAEFPSTGVELPAGAKPWPRHTASDRALAENPSDALESYVHTLISSFDGMADIVPSFGSVKATRGETTLANSAGLECRYPFTLFELEFAVKSTGGPEGSAPGEYWVNERSRHMDTKSLPDEVQRWSRLAREVRRAKELPTGSLPVILPTPVLSEILPAVLGYRLSGAAELRKLALEVGAEVANPKIVVQDDGTLPLGVGTAPCDDEGAPQGRRTLIEGGKVVSRIYDSLHGSAFGKASTANGKRDSPLFPGWFHFNHAPAVRTTNMVLSGPGAGTDEELAESIMDGVWVDQIGFSSPDPVAGTFGGEIRMGYRIRHGKLAEPLKGGTVGGLVVATPGTPSILSSIVAMGSVSRLSGPLKAPACRIDGLSLAGA